jgi:hypothetical protein
MAKSDWESILKTSLWMVAAGLLAIWLANNVMEIAMLVKPRTTATS